MIDTHAHLSVCAAEDGDLVGAARQVGVRRILSVGMDEESNREAIAAAEQHEEVFASVGRHPNGASRRVGSPSASSNRSEVCGM